MAYDAQDPMLAQRRQETHHGHPADIPTTRSNVGMGMGLIVAGALVLILGALVVFAPGNRPATTDPVSAPATGLDNPATMIVPADRSAPPAAVSE